LTGIARKIKEKLPKVKIIAVDPDGSILALPNELNGPIHSYKVEGIGYDFIPIVLDRDSALVDKWYKTFDKESFLMARRLIKREGLLCGGSSGSAMVGALKAIREYKLGPGQRCVVLMPDSVRNYMSKFLSDKWMVDNGFIDPVEQEQKKKEDMEQWGDATIGDLDLPDAVTVSTDVKCSDVLSILKKGGFDQVPVVDNGKMVGYLTVGQLLSKLASKRAQPSDPVTAVMLPFDTKRQFREFTSKTKLADLQQFFEKFSVAFVTEKKDGKDVITKVVSKIDLLQFIVKK